LKQQNVVLQIVVDFFDLHYEIEVEDDVLLI
jgi:hypothetical protein